MINVYVDDLRLCPEGFTIARTYEEAVELLTSNEVNILSLDHDLGEDENGNLRKTGYDLVKYICENGIKVNKVYIHTDNSVGRDNMYETLEACKRRDIIDSGIKVYKFPITPNRY